MPGRGKSRNKWGPALLMSALALVTLTAIIVLAWERDEYPSDAAFLTPPPPLTAQIDPVALSGLHAGARWIQRGDDPYAIMTVETRVTSTRKVAQGQLDLVETRIDNRPAGGRLYRVGPDGLGLVALTGAEITSLIPPLPLMRSPLSPDLVTAWEGKFISKSSTTPGNALVRFDGPETVHTRAGAAYACYRLDLILLTDPKQRPQHTILWFSPGIGIVRQREEVDDKVTNSELVSHEQLAATRPVGTPGS